MIQKKSENGITLIALVVTIVVLLILAGITINLVFSEDGIISKARLAAERTEEGEITVQFSLGGALAGRGGNYHALYQRADKALYHTKEMKKRNLKKE